MTRRRVVRGHISKVCRVRIPLRSASDVARYMARCIREGHKAGGGDSVRWYRQAMIASLLLKALESSQLEERIVVLEQRLLGKA